MVRPTCLLTSAPSAVAKWRVCTHSHARLCATTHAVTFVAIGNGAPDLSANISAIRSGQVALSAGAFTGAAMFVQCVVASEVRFLFIIAITILSIIG